MYLENAVFENFRNIEKVSFTFSRGVNIFYGNNAQGKTNVLEGIYLFAGGKSFRHARERDMVCFEKENARVGIAYATEERTNKMEMRIFRDAKKQMYKNGVKILRAADFIGNFKAVLFFPDHLGIVKNEPSGRRAFIDGAVSQLSPSYLAALLEYGKLLEQRNALLKNYQSYGASFDITLSVLSERLASCAAKITSVRAEYLSRLAEIVDSCLADMTGSAEHISFEYNTSIGKNPECALTDVSENEEKYRKSFAVNVEKEKILGVTLSGSHKDDFEIKLNGKSAKLFCSQGQQRSIALAMKLAEGEISRERSGELPVFLFDDVLSELDSERKKYILSRLAGRQVIITSCAESDFDKAISGSEAKKIYVEHGTFREE
ncbi:MAG: DNA replication/repair protein RecF [Clostridia bacterium]|nr:DNA replication/repair protein RecF [Clostridia bacterium]